MGSNLLYALLMTMLVLAGGLGLIIVILLMGAWRRHLQRQRRPAEGSRSAPPPDIWQVSGQRLDPGRQDPPAVR